MSSRVAAPTACGQTTVTWNRPTRRRASSCTKPGSGSPAQRGYVEVRTRSLGRESPLTSSHLDATRGSEPVGEGRQGCKRDEDFKRPERYRVPGLRLEHPVDPGDAHEEEDGREWRERRTAPPPRHQQAGEGGEREQPWIERMRDGRGRAVRGAPTVGRRPRLVNEDVALAHADVPLPEQPGLGE